MSKKRNAHAVALGRLGAKKGALARAAKLTPEQRQEIARKAARARWEKRNTDTANKEESQRNSSSSKENNED